MPRPQRQPEDCQNHEPDVELEYGHEPKRHSLQEGPTDIALPPHGKQPGRPSGHDDEVSDPCNEKQRGSDQDNPPASDGGSLDLFLEWIIHGLPPSSRI